MVDPEIILAHAELARKIAQDAMVLDANEIRWRDRQQFLERQGYMLRPRYRPGWIPSWTGLNALPPCREDAEPLPVSTPFLVKRVLTMNNGRPVQT